MKPVTTQSDAIPVPTYLHSGTGTGQSYWTRPALLYAIGDEPGFELSPLRLAMVSTVTKAAETLASLDAMPDYAGSQPPHLVPLRQRTLYRMHRALDLLGLPYEPPALPHGSEG